MPEVVHRLESLSTELAVLRDTHERKQQQQQQGWKYAHWLPPLQATFFGMTVVGIVANLGYQAYREESAQHVAAIKLSFATMQERSIKVLRRLLMGQVAHIHLDSTKHRHTVTKPIGSYVPAVDGLLDRLEVIVALRRRARRTDGAPEKSVWVQLVGSEMGSCVLPVHDDIREIILEAVSSLGHFEHLIQTGTMDVDMLPPEMISLIGMVAGDGPFAPKTTLEETFLASLHDFCSRRAEAHPVINLIRRIHPNWTPLQWSDRYDILALQFYVSTRSTRADMTVNVAD